MEQDHDGAHKDEFGVEQGGINSSDLYKVNNNETLDIAQKSGLSVPLGPTTISGIGQADDVALVSNDLHALQALLDLSLQYCEKYHVSLSSEKTKLQVYSGKSSETEAFLGKATSLLNISGHQIAFVDEAEHVGIVRSVAGNLPHLLSRFVAHRRAMFGILPVGLAMAHRGNPAANLQAHSTYCSPVLLSGMSSLVLSKVEMTIIDQYFKVTLQRLQKLRDKTPLCVVLFLGGYLPGKALLHLRILSLFGMICRLPGSIVNKMATYQLTSAKPSSGSWFFQVRELCLQYSIPSPLTLLEYPLTKTRYRSLVKSKVVDFWETNLREEAVKMKENSLKYFCAEFMSLSKPHPIWTTCGSNPFEINKAVVQAKMLSGRYVTDRLSRHWTQNKSGTCSIPGCSGQDLGSLEHLLLYCPALSDTRDKMLRLCQAVASEHEHLHFIISSVLSSQSEATVMQFLLDCSPFPAVVYLKQDSLSPLLERLFYVTRTWCYSMHRSRMTKLGLNQFR